MWKQKFQAFAGHVLFSVFLLGLPLYLLTLHFYPGALFWEDGGFEVIKIALAIDLVLGPVLTFCIFKKGKKGLLLDLAFITVLQFAVFGFGVWTMLDQRPVAYVFGGQFFHAVPRHQIEGTPKAEMNSVLGEVPLPYFYVYLPKDLKQREALAHKAMTAGRPFHVMTELWTSMDEKGREYIADIGFNDQEIQKIKDPQGQAIAKKLLSTVPSAQKDQYVICILQMRYANALVLFNKNTGQIERIEKANVGSLGAY